MRVVTAHCRYGKFAFYNDDEFVGRSLDLYGEYSPDEVLLMERAIPVGATVIEVGANIGALTVPISQRVGENGRVIAFEPQPENGELLEQNLVFNGCGNVEMHCAAVGAQSGCAVIPSLASLDHKNYGRVELGKGSFGVAVVAIDDLKLDQLWMIKIDAEGSELDVLKGAEKTIRRLHPMIYVENDREDKSQALISYLVDLGYRLFWHRPAFYNPDNYRGTKDNVFGNIVSLNMLGAHEDSVGIKIKHMDEVADLRLDAVMFDREIARYKRYIARDPADLHARAIVAHYLNLMQRSDEAVAVLDEIIAIEPENFQARTIRSLMDLQSGNFVRGWQGYELRYHQENTVKFGNRPHTGKPWDGRPTNEPVLIWSEQGYGDSIMFGRFMADAMERAPHAFLEIQPELYELFEISGIAPGALYRRGRTLPPYALHCSIPSLPAVLGLGGDLSRPPYLSPDDTMLQSWLDRPHPKIGICTRGSKISERPFTRDIAEKAFEKITARRPVINLNQDGQFESFADTAAVLCALDLVITVDTSVAHLAGALGVPVWLLLSFDPDWRWGLKGESSIWYPTMRIFRQRKLLDWSNVVEQIATELEQLEGKNERSENTSAKHRPSGNDGAASAKKRTAA